MELEFNPSKETLESLFVNVAEPSKDFPNITFNGVPGTAIEKFGIFRDAVRLATFISTHRKNFTLITTRDVKGVLTYWVQYARGRVTEPLFSTFKLAGIYTTQMMVGYTPTQRTLHLTNKVFRDLCKTSERFQSTIFCELYFTVAYLATTDTLMSKGDKSYIFEDTLQNNFEMPFKTFVDTLPNMSDMRAGHGYVAVAATSYDLTEISFRAPFGKDFKIAYGAASSVRYVVGTLSESKAPFVGFVTNAGARAYKFVAHSGKIGTDYDMCLLELETDSLCRSIADCFDGNVTVVSARSEEVTLPNDVYIYSADEIEELFDSLNPEVKSIVAKCKAAGFVYAETCDFSSFATHGYRVNSEYSDTTPEEIRVQYAEDAYAQELYKQVHPYYDTFPIGNLEANVRGFANGAIYSMAFVGESGTGKSTVARIIPYRCGIPYVSVNFSVNIEEADLFGSMIPNPFKASAEDPEFIWQDGIITKAVRNGYCAILEEINFARPGVLGKLNSLLDENRQLDLANGELIKAHPNFRLIATCNVAYEGTNRFNKALINRFNDVTVFEAPTRDEIVNAIKTRTKYSNATKIAKILDVYEALQKYIKEQGIPAVVSMRQILNIFNNGKYYKDAYDAVVRIMLNGAFIEDVEYLESFKQTVLPAFDLKFKI